MAAILHRNATGKFLCNKIQWGACYCLLLSSLSIQGEFFDGTYLTIILQFKAISVALRSMIEMSNVHKYLETNDKRERSATLATLGLERSYEFRILHLSQRRIQGGFDWGDRLP